MYLNVESEDSMKKFVSLLVVILLCATWLTALPETVIEEIRPIGDTSRKNPLLLGQTVLTEINMYDEYKYSHTIEFKEFILENGTLTVKLHIDIGECSDGVDREIHVWDTDYDLFDSEYSQIKSMADEVGTEKTGIQLSGLVLMFPETSTDMIVVFDEVPEGKLYFRFEPTNSYNNDEQNKAKAAVWFEVNP